MRLNQSLSQKNLPYVKQNYDSFHQSRIKYIKDNIVNTSQKQINQQNDDNTKLNLQKQKERYLIMDLNNSKNKPSKVQNHKSLYNNSDFNLLDPVKKLNNIVNLAKVDNIRRKQINERSQMDKEAFENEKDIDLMMEIDRLKKVFKDTDFYIQQKKNIMNDHSKLIQQINDRSLQHFKEQEEKEIDRQLQYKQYDLFQKDKIQNQKNKKRDQQNQMKDIQQQTNQQIAKKKQLKKEELAQDLKDMEFLRQKDLQFEAIIAEQKKLAEIKDIQLMHLRDLQQIREYNNSLHIQQDNTFEENQSKERYLYQIELQKEVDKRKKKIQDYLDGLALQMQHKANQKINEKQENLKIIQFHQQQLDEYNQENERIKKELFYKCKKNQHDVLMQIGYQHKQKLNHKIELEKERRDIDHLVSYEKETIQAYKKIQKDQVIQQGAKQKTINQFNRINI